MKTNLGVYGEVSLAMSPVETSQPLRPKSWATVKATSRFSNRFECHTPIPGHMPPEQIGRIQKYWAIVHDPYEAWEVEYAYMPANLFDRLGKRTEMPWFDVPVPKPQR